MEQRIGRLKIGPGMDPDVDMGPIYSAEHRASIIDWIDKGVAEGAELVHDGRPFHVAGHPDGYFLGVTLFDHVKPEMEIYREEIFGPVLGIVRATTFDEALSMINGHQYGNGTAIFTTDGGAARRFELEVDVPMIGVDIVIPVPAGYLYLGGFTGRPSAISRCAARTASASSPGGRWSPSAGQNPGAERPLAWSSPAMARSAPFPAVGRNERSPHEHG